VLADLPAGWSVELAHYDRPLELFTIEGALVVDGKPLGSGGYVHLPPTGSTRRLSAPDGAHALVMADEPTTARSDDPIELIDTNTGRWQTPDVSPDIPPGILIKLLRVDPVKNDWTWVTGIVPGWQEHRAEIHPTVEEAFLVRGDALLGERGDMTPGSYFWRPPNVLHGPLYSRNGALFFFRTKGGSLEVTWEEVPNWADQVARYSAEEPYYSGDLSATSE
jgi:hypothetical protein